MGALPLPWRHSPRPPSTRRGDERGAIGVVVALIMVPMLGFAAIAIDLGAMYAERQELQSGADAGALAIAQDCGRGTCGPTSRTAQSLATANLRHASSRASVTALGATRVTVRDTGIRHHLFAPVLGIDASTVAASATATWGSPTGGTAKLPLAISWCEWQAQTGGGPPTDTTDRVISLPKKSDTGCAGPSGAAVPGGFGWLHSDGGTCRTTTRISERAGSSTGATPSAGCSRADLAAARGTTVILPVFADASSPTDPAWYQVYGYAAFTITGYHFGGVSSGSPCSGDDSCIKGHFARFVDLSNAFSFGPDAPALGASIVRLSE